MRTSTIILGIDPGSQKAGYGVLRLDEHGHLHCLALGTLRLSRTHNAYEKLAYLQDETAALIVRYGAQVLAIEKPFLGTNAHSFLTLIRAQGAMITSAVRAGIDVVEYMPTQVKRSVAGAGAADKESVRGRVETLLGICFGRGEMDASDALAVALCHALRCTGGKNNALVGKEKRSTRRSSLWENFVADNPDRVKK